MNSLFIHHLVVSGPWVYTLFQHFLLFSEVCFPGHLSPVGDLNISENATSFNISWTPPFSLDVTDEGLGPDMWYSVIIYNVTDETNTVEIPCTDCDDITQTYYIFTPDYFISCHKYQFSIIPINGAGQGETSSVIYLNGMQSKIPLCCINDLYFQRDKFFNGSN